jgi:hypothetical protein
MQLELPLLGLYVPTGHDKQDIVTRLPDTGANVPGRQAEQTVVSGKSPFIIALPEEQVEKGEEMYTSTTRE